jgi:hypothetical protein
LEYRRLIEKGKKAGTWERLPWKKIVEKACKERQQIDQRAVEEAHSSLGDRFAEVFSYQGDRNQRIPMTKDVHIAAKWREICNQPGLSNSDRDDNYFK